MGKIVRIADFIGQYAITQNPKSETQLQSFIDKYELPYLYDLLGVTLGNLFYADITTPYTDPDTAIYATIFNPLASDENTICSMQIRSNGIKEMLLGFIYWEYVKAQKIKNTITGNVAQQNETSREACWVESNIYSNYNEAVKTYKTIQWYVNKNSTDYPDYNGLSKQLAHWAN